MLDRRFWTACEPLENWTPRFAGPKQPAGAAAFECSASPRSAGPLWQHDLPFEPNVKERRRLRDYMARSDAAARRDRRTRDQSAMKTELTRNAVEFLALVLSHYRHGVRNTLTYDFSRRAETLAGCHTCAANG